MRVENLTLANFNNREYQVHTYVLEPNPELVEQKRPLAHMYQLDIHDY